MKKVDIIWPSGEPDEQVPEGYEEVMVSNLPGGDPEIAHRAFVRIVPEVTYDIYESKPREPITHIGEITMPEADEVEPILERAREKWPHLEYPFAMAQYPENPDKSDSVIQAASHLVDTWMKDLYPMEIATHYRRELIRAVRDLEGW